MKVDCCRHQFLLMFALFLSVWSILMLSNMAILNVEAATSSPNSRTEIDAFQTWFEKYYQGKVPVYLSPAGEGMRMGVFAKEKILSESLYLSIPLNVILGEATIFPTPVIGPVLEKLQSKFGPLNRHQTTLCLFLLYEKFVKGPESYFYPYISLLPQQHDSPEFYTAGELQLLAGTDIPSQVASEKQKHTHELQWLERNILKIHKDVFPPAVFSSLKNYMWAQGILSSRMIWWDGAPHLVPMLDMINCRQGPKNPHRVHSTKREGNKANTYAPWTFEKGEQVFENYGQPNPTYFFYHGFVMLPNVHDCVKLNLKNKLSDSKNVGRKNLEWIKKFRLYRDEYCIAPTKYAEALVVSRLAVAKSGSQIEEREGELETMTKKGGAPNKKFSNSNERKALKFLGSAMQNALEQQFSQFPYDEAWEKKIENLSFRRTMAIRYRETQRALLNDTVNALRAIQRKIPKTRKNKKKVGAEEGSGVQNNQERSAEKTKSGIPSSKSGEL